MLERIELEAFLTLAEELHFGRTAERLGVTTGRVSQTIKKLERHVGVPLFERTSRKVTLTPVGQQLYDDLRPGYDLIDTGLEKAINSGRGIAGVLRVGFVGAAAGQIMMNATRLMAARHPDCEVQLHELHMIETFAELRAGSIDTAIVYLPVKEPDIVVGPILFSEPRVLAVPARHPLARRESVSLEDLASTRVLQGPATAPDYMREDRVPRRTPSGRPIEAGPVMRTLQEALALIAAGKGVFPVGAQLMRYYARSDIAYVPFHDAPPLDWAPIWLATAATARVRAFSQTALDAARSQPEP